ncbi:MAG: hypothetical protein WBQ76_06215 [Candidatus Korobacteraceae bacterium]
MSKQRAKQAVEDSYSRFLSSLKLVTIAMTESRFRINRDAFLDEPEDVFMTLSSRTHKIAKTFFELEAKLEVKAARKKTGAGSLQLQAVYLLHIHAKPPISKGAIKRFADEELRLLIWPYLREYVASTCGRMHVPPIILPLPEAE